MRIGRLGLAASLWACFLTTACTTPIEVKTASRAQLELITSLNTAAGDLQNGLADFHRAKKARIIEEGRMLVARQAIDTATPANTALQPVAADQLFAGYHGDVQKWIDYAFRADRIDEEIKDLENHRANEQNPLLRGALDLDLQDLRELKAVLANRPERVRAIEATIMRDLKNEEEAARSVRAALDLLQAQLAVMKALAGRVDAWLAIDATVSQEQADGLKKSLSDAIQVLSGSQR